MRGTTWIGCLLFAIGAQGLVACDADPQEQALAACSVICACEAPPLPSAQDACVNECVFELSRFQIPQPCLDCVVGHARRCATIERDCAPVCQGGIDDDPVPPPQPF
jgi:hypothetical protein